MANIFPIDFEEKLTMAQDDYILFSDSEDWNKIKKAQYSNLKGEKGDKWDKGDTWETWPQWPQGIQWIQWPQWEQWEKWDKGDTWATGARIDSAAFSGNDIVFGETDGNTVTLVNAKTTLTWPQWPQWEQGIQGIQWLQGDKWDKWDTWDAATITVWTTTTWAAWTSASVINSWTSWAAILDFTIPKWDKWDKWDAATATAGTTTTLSAWSSATVVNSGSSSAAVFDFWIPKWDKWDTWASITSAAFSWNDILFTKDDSTTVSLPDAKNELKWPQGEQWIQGIQWPQWETWATGTAATITVWSTTTWATWSSASVTNSWTSSAAVLDFTIPKGDKGDKWDTGNTWATGNGIASVTSSKSWKVTTVTITETDWDSTSFQVSDGNDGEWAWDVLWPNSSTDWDVVLFDWNTWKLIKDSWKAFTPAWIWALADSTKYWKTLSLDVNTTTYVVTATLKDQDGTTLSTDTIDLPLESVVVNGSYDSVNKKIILTLENGNTVEFSVADLVAGLQSEITSSNKLDADLVDDSTSTNKFVTASDKTTWSWKQDKLVAWTNITIAADWKTISSTDTTYSAASSSTLWLVKLWDDTVQSVAANAVTGTASRTYAMQVNGSWQLVVNIPRTDTTYTASDFDIKDLADSTWLRTTWSNKQDALTTQTAYTSKGSATKVPQISTNSLWQVTWITEVTITQPTKVSDLTNDSGFITEITSGDVTTALWYTPQSALSTQTAYTSKWTSTKVPTISTNTLGQVTAITETNIAFPVTSVNWSTWAVSLTIPTITTTTATLTTAWWSSSTQTVSVTGVTASNTVIVSPAPASISTYADNGVYCYSQGSGTLTFKCSSTPSSSITVNVVIMS